MRFERVVLWTTPVLLEDMSDKSESLSFRQARKRMLDIHQTTPKEIEQAASLLRVSWKLHAEQTRLIDGEYLLKPEKASDYLGKRIDSENNILLSAVIDGEMAGFVVYEISETPPYWKYKRRLEVIEIVVAEKYRGNDLAGKLLEQIEQRATSKDIQIITGDIFAFNAASRRAFDKRGYTSEYQVVMKVIA